MFRAMLLRYYCALKSPGNCDKMQIFIHEVGSGGQGIMSNTSTHSLAVAGWWTIVLVASLKKGVIVGATKQLEGVVMLVVFPKH